jgi:multicomponent Na+:H+ antiporter subunit B
LKDDITRVVFRYVLLLVLMYGFYVIAHGHLSPGGGFAGGVVLGLGVLLYLLIFDLKWRERLHYLPLDIAVVFIGIGSLMEAIKYLLPTRHGPTGMPGELFSVGIISVVNLGIGLLVASTILSIFYLMAEEQKK